MYFLPAAFDILGNSILETAIVEVVVSAVSPAVIVSKMINSSEEKGEIKKGVLQLILAGASMDDVFVMIIFTVLISYAQGQDISIIHFLYRFRLF